MNAKTKLLSAALIGINFLLAYYVIAAIPLRLDLTSDKIYTLTENSEKLLDRIEEPVLLSFYYSRSVEGLPVAFKNFASRVREMLRQYERASKGMIRLRTIDPEPDTEDEEAAIAAGLHGEQLGDGQRVFLGLVAAQGENEEVIAFFNPQKESFLEYDISRLIYDVQQFAKPRLALLSALPLEAPPSPPPMPGRPPPNQQQDQHLLEELRRFFEVEMVEPSAEALPDNTDLLALLHPPQGLSEPLLFAIDQHVLAGKPLFAAVDPHSRHFASQQRQGGMMGQPNPNASSDLPRLFEAWGVAYDAGQAVGDLEIAYTQAGRVEPTWLVFDRERQNEELIPLAQLNAILMIDAGAFRLEEDSPLALEPALTTSKQAGLTPAAPLAFLEGGQILRDIEPQGESLVVAGFLGGTFPTAFPDGPPQGEGEEERDAESGAATESSPEPLSSGEGNVFLAADSDWLLDAFSIRRLNFLGTRAVQPLNDNQNLASNVFDYLGGSELLIGIRGKGASIRPFEVVQRLEQEAQQAYQKKLETIEARLSEIQQEIQSLVQQQNARGLITATPEIQEALQELREREAEMRAERRAIRKALREDIENLELVLVAQNMLYAPALLVAFALYFQRRRRKQTLNPASENSP